MASVVAGITIVAGAFPEIIPSLGHHLISEGIAFIIIGLVGSIMSWTTFEIGTGIKELVREVGVQNQEALNSLDNTLKKISESQDRIAESQDRTAESQDRTAESMKEVSVSLKENSKTLQSILESQKEIAIMFKQIKDGDRA